MSLRHHVAKLAQEHPEIQPALTTALKTAGLKTAGFELGDVGHRVLQNLHADYETRTHKAFDKIQAQLEKALLKADFVLDRRATYFNRWDHHEGPRFTGTVSFVDKRDHQVRDEYQVNDDLEKFVGIYAQPKMGSNGVWTVNVGE